MVIRAGKIFINSVIMVLTITVLLVCGLVIRLSIAPLDLAFARDTIVGQATASLPDWQIQFDKAVVGWDYANMRPWVTLDNFVATRSDKSIRTSFPKVQIGLSRYSLAGQLSVSQLIVNSGTVRVRDDGNGDGFEFPDIFKKEGGGPDPAVFKPVVDIFLETARRLRLGTPDLAALSFTKTSVLIDKTDQETLQIDIPSVRLSLSRQNMQIEAQIDAQTVHGATQVRLHADVMDDLDLRADDSGKKVILSLDLTEIIPANFTSYLPKASFINAVNIPVALNLETELTHENGLEHVVIRAELGQGYIQDDTLYPSPANVHRGTIRAHYDAAHTRLSLDEISVEIDPGPVVATGDLTWSQGYDKPGINLEANLSQVQVSDILSYWPITRRENGLQKGGRAWVFKHLLSGEAYGISFKVGQKPDGSGGLPGENLWSVDFSFRDLDSYTLQTLPPIYEASGRGHVVKDTLDLSVSHAKIAEMEIGPSRMIIDNLSDKEEQVGHFNVKLNGELDSVFEIMNRHPLYLVEKVNIPTDRIRGSADVDVHFSVPFLKSRAKEVTYKVQASLNDIAVDDILDGEGLRRGTVDLNVDRERLYASGTGWVNRVPLEFSWTEVLRKKDDENTNHPVIQIVDDFTTDLTVQGYVTADQLGNLRVPASRYISGLVEISAAFKGRALQIQEGNFLTDLTSATLFSRELGWRKPAGAEARAAGNLLFSDDRNKVTDLRIWGNVIEATLNLDWGRDSESLRVSIDAEKMGSNRFKATVNQEGENDFDITVDAARFDLRPFIGVEGGIDVNQDADAVIDEVSAADRSDLTIKGNIAEVILLNGETMTGTSLDIRFENGAPAAAHIMGSLGIDAIPVEVTVAGDTPTARNLTVTSENAGELMRGLGYFAHLQGGTLELTGTTSGWGSDLKVSARAKSAGARLVPKTLLGDKVTIGTVSGVDTYVSSEGLLLTEIDAPFSYDSGLLDFENVKANAPSIGMTMEGQLETQIGLINVNGVFVPAYGLNSILGKIPIVGGLFSGGDGGGLIGFTYRVKGPMAKPNVTVNALSGLAPGFLRAIFSGKKGKVADVDIPDKLDDTKIPKSKEEPASNGAGP